MGKVVGARHGERDPAADEGEVSASHHRNFLCDYGHFQSSLGILIGGGDSRREVIRKNDSRHTKLLFVVKYFLLPLRIAQCLSLSELCVGSVIISDDAHIDK